MYLRWGFGSPAPTPSLTPVERGEGISGCGLLHLAAGLMDGGVRRVITTHQHLELEVIPMGMDIT